MDSDFYVRLKNMWKSAFTKLFQRVVTALLPEKIRPL